MVANAYDEISPRVHRCRELRHKIRRLSAQANGLRLAQGSPNPTRMHRRVGLGCEAALIISHEVVMLIVSLDNGGNGSHG
jgi:hypothetical protein